ncbi:MAG: mechanosensitive ion channel family protein, partial [Chthoniobacterales bacterium]
MAETAEQVASQDDVRQALEQTAGKRPPPVKAETKDKFLFVTHALVVLGCAVVSYLIRLNLVPLPQTYVDLSQRAIRGVVTIVILLAIAKAVSVYGIGRVGDASTRYTLRRILHLVAGVLIALVAISVVFVNWYTALISVGVLSVIAGLSLQAPMTSFIGWVYIL